VTHNQEFALARKDAVAEVRESKRHSTRTLSAATRSAAATFAAIAEQDDAAAGPGMQPASSRPGTGGPMGEAGATTGVGAGLGDGVVGDAGLAAAAAASLELGLEELAELAIHCHYVTRP
jgi:hypothetical protein